MFALGDNLEIADLVVETREILLDDKGELVDLDGFVIEDGLLACDYNC